jgi:hypothetical protein
LSYARTSRPIRRGRHPVAYRLPATGDGIDDGTDDGIDARGEHIIGTPGCPRAAGTLHAGSLTPRMT